MGVEMVRVVTGLAENLPRLGEILHHQIGPLLGRTLAKTAMHKFMPMYVERLLQEMGALATRSEVKALSLKELVGRCQLAATSYALLGSSFTDDIYDDVACLDESIYARLYNIPFDWRPSARARERLIIRFSAYITQAEAGSVEGDLMTNVIDVFKANKLALKEKAGLLLVFLWGSYANPVNAIFWVLAQILADQNLAARLYTEVDNVLRAHGTAGRADAVCTIDLPALLSADSCALDGPGFPLLDSVVRETIRLRQTSTLIRQASCDTELVVDAAAGRRLSVRKGEFVMANMMGTHWDERWHDQADKFVPDRYVSSMAGVGGDKSTRPKQSTPTFFGWGAGRDICKGRHLAAYEMKLFTALCVHHFRLARADAGDKHEFDLSPAESFPPKAKGHSVGVQEADRDINVFLNSTGRGS
ncbi:cytochrome P450 [Phlebopus sp. FC_14]|nr:cytochrome P450 [Phlebopus sp. FC_14]